MGFTAKQEFVEQRLKVLPRIITAMAEAPDNYGKKIAK